MSEDDNAKEFSRRLMRAMADRFWNGAEMARQAALHMPDGKFGRDLITRYRRGAKPRDAHVMALAKALRMEPGDLMPGFLEVVERTERPGTPLVLLPNGRIQLNIRREVDLATATKILELLHGKTD